MTVHHLKKIKSNLHNRNLHRNGYDFNALVVAYPLLTQYVQRDHAPHPTIDFSNPYAVKTLNAALLAHYYQIQDWDIPAGALCPPIPGRVDYIHHVFDLLHETNKDPKKIIRMLDIGTGASGIYSLLASQIYSWDCVASDINSASLDNVKSILDNNPNLRTKVETRLQKNKHHIFENIIHREDKFDLCVCNPPFHSSPEEAAKATALKQKNLAKEKSKPNSKHSILNFGGIESELWCNGGEKLFLKKFIKESVRYKTQCTWFTSLVSKSDTLRPAEKWIQKHGATEIKIIPMHQGHKITRILAWRF